jgi:hypothetical protein
MQHLINIDLIVLFFFLGVIGSWLKSDLAIPDAVSRFLSIFLLLSLGLKGGHEVRFAQDLTGFGSALIIGMATCIAIPLVAFYSLRRSVGPANATAIAASYGSVSAVTFITAIGLLANEGITSSGYMIAVMALMEIPAILLAFWIYKLYAPVQKNAEGSSSILTSKSVVLLLGGFVIGLLMNESSWESIAPVMKDSFKGVLAFFLLDLGIAAQRQLKPAWQHKTLALIIACFFPLLVGTIVLVITGFTEMSAGDQILMAVLAGSASYIAAPAAIRSSIPEANPSLYVALPLALTFPMNVVFGIPFYIELNQLLNGGLKL